jgi:hypothetical protein
MVLFMREREEEAWGFIVRYCDGHGILAGSGCLPAVNDALTAEGEACLAALWAVIEGAYLTSLLKQTLQIWYKHCNLAALIKPRVVPFFRSYGLY